MRTTHAGNAERNPLSPGTVFSPRRLWRRLTFLKSFFVILASLGAGGWLAGLRVPANELSTDFLKFLREDSHRTAQRITEALGYTTNEITVSAGDDEIMDDYRWENRRRVQRPFKALFWVSAVLAWLTHYVRRHPLEFDNCWPRIIAERIPLLVLRWKLCGFDGNGREVVSEFYRTATAARRAAKLHVEAARFLVEPDRGGHEEYETYRRDLRFLCGY